MFALIITLDVLTTYLLVKVKYAPGSTRNKLTLRPYYLLLMYSVVFMIQMTVTIVFEHPNLIVLCFINLIKMSLENTAVAI